MGDEENDAVIEDPKDPIPTEETKADEAKADEADKDMDKMLNDRKGDLPEGDAA